MFSGTRGSRPKPSSAIKFIFFSFAMNVECVICLENLQPNEAISNTPCGHVFHHPCVAKWFQRSSTCPECRKKVHGKKTHKIFLNFVDENTVMEELTSMLESEIETLKHKVTAQEKKIAQDVKNENILIEKNKMLQNQIDNLVTEMKDNIAQFEKIESDINSSGDKVAQILKKLQETIMAHTTEKTLIVPNSKNACTLNSAKGSNKKHS